MDWQSQCKIEVIYHGTGTSKPPGGQQAGTPPSGIRVTHEPTMIMAQVGEGRSQHVQRKIAMEMIEYALHELRILPAHPTPQ